MSVRIGTPNTSTATKVMLLGSGELAKEVVIELQRLGVEVIAVDRYEGAPAQQVAHRYHVIDMLDGEALRALIERERPDIVVPEIEAISTVTLQELEAAGVVRVVPTARAARLTMDREGIRRLAAEELGLPTSSFLFVDTFEEFQAAVVQIGLPCVVKPVMSSSGKGQSLLRTMADVVSAWEYAQTGGRGNRGMNARVIVESFVKFDYEITLLTVQHSGGCTICEPVGHVQIDGDYRESWQPQPMSAVALAKARAIAEQVTSALGGFGIFGVELFVVGDDVLFSEVSPRPHDTGLVTLISQDLSEFALHARALLGLPIPALTQYGPSASCAVLATGDGVPIFDAVDAALVVPGTELRLFGKPEVHGHRRVAVTLARGESISAARETAQNAAAALGTHLVQPTL